MTYAEYFCQKRQKQTEMINAGIERVLSVRRLDFAGDFACFVKSAHEDIFREAMPKIAGLWRERNICKSEHILLGRSVRYTPHTEIRAELQSLFARTRAAEIGGTSEEKINAAADFAKSLWQVHPFENGNTRLTAVMLVLYLRHLGFAADNAPFRENARLFRNALVRAVYSDERLECDESFLHRFLCNAALGERHDISSCSQIAQALLKKK